MTRKDFELIAAAIAVGRAVHMGGLIPKREQQAAGRALDTVARDLAERLADRNPRFDKARFLKACGVQS